MHFASYRDEFAEGILRKRLCEFHSGRHISRSGFFRIRNFPYVGFTATDSSLSASGSRGSKYTWWCGPGPVLGLELRTESPQGSVISRWAGGVSSFD